MSRETERTTTSGHADEKTDLVPSRQQYLDLKALHPRAILLYRLGDFYETFDDDAKVVARDLRITLTSRSFGRSGRTPMAGIPHHALNHYLARLLAQGRTVAIAEQLTEPGRGLVERAVTRVLTPGTVADAALLPAAENRYLAAVSRAGDRLGLARVDVSTGEFAAAEFGGPTAKARLADELARLGPAEGLLPDDALVDGFGADLSLGHVTRLEHWHFEPDRARAVLREHFGVRSLDAFGSEARLAATGAAGAILTYVRRTNPSLLPLLTGLRVEEPGQRVGLDQATRRNLELVRSMRDGGRRGSLLAVLDQTRTAMGARALRRLVGEPLRDLDELRRRQDLIAALVTQNAVRVTLAGGLPGVGDLERLTGRIVRGQAAARDFLALAQALRGLPAVLEALRDAEEWALAALADEVDPADDVLSLVDSAVEEEPDSARIRAGYFPELDAAIHGARDTRVWLAGLERVERERTGIRSLKVGFNKVFGYYLEVTRPNLSLVPDDYVRKQTIANGERFVTVPLKDAEARILAAEEEIASLERAALARLSGEVARNTARLLRLAGQLAELDALGALAEVAARESWVRPALEESDVLTIVGGRHPVVEAGLAGDAFIPNDCQLGGDGARILLVTGPNMGGKSTYLRQVALIVLLAQIGSFVPALAARVGLVDRIFTRVGAHDDLAGGASTFMVEMVETATILHQATRQSLIVLDEVGRGTSTFDGLAIARAVVEDLHDRIAARTLFATHYLELTSLAGCLPDVANAHVDAVEADDRVVFLYALRSGPASRAYGIQVARLAGLPGWVANRATALLAELESGQPGRDACPAGPVALIRNGRVTDAGATIQLALDGFAPRPVLSERITRELGDLDLFALTPREALDWLFERQRLLRGEP